VDAPADLNPESRWFRQTFVGQDNLELYAGVSAQVAGELARDLASLLDIVFQSIARAMGAIAGSPVTCGSLNEETSAPYSEKVVYELAGTSVRYGRVALAVPLSALDFLRSVTNRTEAAAPVGSMPRHLDSLLNIDLPVRVSFGTTDMPLADVLRLATGSIVEFHHMLSEPVNIVVNDCLVARGDVVVVDSNYGVRISEVITRAN
jgi:flagellar motor switch protein FliN